MFDPLVSHFTQSDWSGGIHTSPFIRLLLYSIASLQSATDILETGYDAGLTTQALSETGANVIGIDNCSEYGDVDRFARRRLENYPNCLLINREILDFLTHSKLDTQFDLIYIDDNHNHNHVKSELELLKDLVKPCGIIAFHDVIMFPELLNVIDEILPTWNVIVLDAYSPQDKQNYGIAIAQRPNE